LISMPPWSWFWAPSDLWAWILGEPQSPVVFREAPISSRAHDLMSSSVHTQGLKQNYFKWFSQWNYTLLMDPTKPVFDDFGNKYELMSSWVHEFMSSWAHELMSSWAHELMSLQTKSKNWFLMIFDNKYELMSSWAHELMSSWAHELNMSSWAKYELISSYLFPTCLKTVFRFSL
jgi:hypothetical protein